MHAACRNYGNHFTISKISLKPQRHCPGRFHFILTALLVGNTVSMLKEGSNRTRMLVLFHGVRYIGHKKKIMDLVQNKNRDTCKHIYKTTR